MLLLPVLSAVALLLASAAHADGTETPAETAALAAQRSSSCTRSSVVLPGVEVLLADSVHLVRGRRVGLLTNHTGVDRCGRRTVDLLVATPGVQVVALFAPEHGLTGTARGGAVIRSGRDSASGVRGGLALRRAAGAHRRHAARRGRAALRRAGRRRARLHVRLDDGARDALGRRGGQAGARARPAEPDPRRPRGRRSDRAALPHDHRAPPGADPLRPHAGRAGALARRRRSRARHGGRGAHARLPAEPLVRRDRDPVGRAVARTSATRRPRCSTRGWCSSRRPT